MKIVHLTTLKKLLSNNYFSLWSLAVIVVLHFSCNDIEQERYMLYDHYASIIHHKGAAPIFPVIFCYGYFGKDPDTQLPF